VGAGIVEALGWRADVFVSLHLDHAKDLGLVEAALDAGYSSVLADGSGMSFEESIEFVGAVRGLLLKGYKGLTLESIVVEASLVEFARAEDFVEKVGPDLLAPFVVRDGRDRTKIEEIKEVSQTVETPLVLHNSSSKSDQEIREAIAAGVVKVNWNTCLREAWTEGLRQTLSSQSDVVKPYDVLEVSVEEVKRVVKEKVRLINPKS
jgi:fructose/tagatose bisphosphate aldolase